MNNSFEELIREKNDKEIIQIINAKEGDYRPEAVETAKVEYIKRGLHKKTKCLNCEKMKRYGFDTCFTCTKSLLKTASSKYKEPQDHFSNNNSLPLKLLMKEFSGRSVGDLLMYSLKSQEITQINFEIYTFLIQIKPSLIDITFEILERVFFEIILRKDFIKTDCAEALGTFKFIMNIKAEEQNTFISDDDLFDIFNLFFLILVKRIYYDEKVYTLILNTINPLWFLNNHLWR